jgi:hypothetical protein
VTFAVRALGWVRGKPFVEASVLLNPQPPETAVEVVDLTFGKQVRSDLPPRVQARAAVIIGRCGSTWKSPDRW